MRKATLCCRHEPLVTSKSRKEEGRFGALGCITGHSARGVEIRQKCILKSCAKSKYHIILGKVHLHGQEVGFRSKTKVLDDVWMGQVLEDNDPFIKAAEHVASAGNEILRHGTYLVDLFPVCE